MTEDAEAVAKLADELGKMWPSVPRAEVERSAAVGVQKARELREREARRKKK